jgi:hypothetical protein
MGGSSFLIPKFKLFTGVKDMGKYACYKKERNLIFSTSVVADIMSLATFAKNKKNCCPRANNDLKINLTKRGK